MDTTEHFWEKNIIYGTKNINLGILLNITFFHILREKRQYQMAEGGGLNRYRSWNSSLKHFPNVVVTSVSVHFNILESVITAYGCTRDKYTPQIF